VLFPAVADVCSDTMSIFSSVTVPNFPTRPPADGENESVPNLAARSDAGTGEAFGKPVFETIARFNIFNNFTFLTIAST
jgi:hypothetical protein